MRGPRLSASVMRKRLDAVRSLASPCRLCPRRCGVDRDHVLGTCGCPPRVRVAYTGPHRGEEPALRGGAGAGTIFVVGCSLKCIYCQNYQISHENTICGRDVTPEALAQCYLELERQGCCNIEWVTPTHQLPDLLESLCIAREQGLQIPLVYNTSGYERLEVLRLLDGIVDIYLPDAKYSRGALARALSHAPDYVTVNRRALLEMHRQVGPLRLDQDQRAFRGLLVRHLVLPGQLEQTREVLSWLARTLGSGVWVSLMSQYAPIEALGGGMVPGPLSRPLTRREVRRATELLHEAGLLMGWVQQRQARRCFLPDFRRDDPFARPPSSGT